MSILPALKNVGPAMRDEILGALRALEHVAVRPVVDPLFPSPAVAAGSGLFCPGIAASALLTR